MSGRSTAAALQGKSGRAKHCIHWYGCSPTEPKQEPNSFRDSCYEVQDQLMVWSSCPSGLLGAPLTWSQVNHLRAGLHPKPPGPQGQNSWFHQAAWQQETPSGSKSRSGFLFIPLQVRSKSVLTAVDWSVEQPKVEHCKEGLGDSLASNLPSMTSDCYFRVSGPCFWSKKSQLYFFSNYIWWYMSLH